MKGPVPYVGDPPRMRRIWLSIAVSIVISVLLFTNFLAYRHEPEVLLNFETEVTPHYPESSLYLSKVPKIGFGTWQLETANASEAVKQAIVAGYRHIDCASSYWNEPLVGKGIAEGLAKTRLRREDIWVTSKLWNYHHHRVKDAFEDTLRDLGLEYLDLYLMHWPVEGIFDPSDDTNMPPSRIPVGPHRIEFLQTWKELSQLLISGKVRHIGVANFAPKQLDELIASSSVKPFALQMELHPYLPQTAWLQKMKGLDIHPIAYSPLGNMNPIYGYPPKADPPRSIEHPIVKTVAERRGCTPAQVIIRWGMSRGVSVIPKSSHLERIKENFGGTECFLEHEDYKDMERLGLEQEHRFNDPRDEWRLTGSSGLYVGLDGS
ncbi:aldo/keto reductase family protein [Xylariaceae sp. FL0016]|nr:aldo/keto reductase family protein [Xylariaceae sp. FL0016]